MKNQSLYINDQAQEPLCQGMAMEPRETSQRVYIIVLNYNGWFDTIECLESLLRLDYDNYRLIVIDNASADGSSEKISLWANGDLDVWRPPFSRLRPLIHPPVSKPLNKIELTRQQAESGADSAKSPPDSLIFIHSDHNLGFAGGNNIGIRYALGDPECAFVWLVNNDTVVELDALSQMVRRLAQKPKAGLCGSSLLYYHQPDMVQALAGATYNRWLATTRHIGAMQVIDTGIDPESVERRLSYIIGASVLLTRKFLEQVGLMSEDYFFYFDELDWSTRARGRFTLAYAPASFVYHKEGRTIGADRQAWNKSRRADYYWIRNRLRVTRRFFPYALPLVYLSLLGAIFNRIRRQQWDRVPMILRIALGL